MAVFRSFAKPRPAGVVPVLLALLAGACSSLATVRSAPPPADAVLGTWRLADGSTTVMRVARDAGALAVEAWAGDTKVSFEVSAVSWDGRHLSATFRYPPTNVTTTSELDLVNADRLEGTVTGAYSGHETWLRAE